MTMTTTTEVKGRTEFFKDVKNFEGLYKVSNRGRVVNKDGKELKGFTNTSGYIQHSLYKRGKCKKLQLHRIVAEAFLVQENGCSVVCHVDGDKTNNDISNLVWSTQSWNLKDPLRTHRIRQNKNWQKAVSSKSKKVVAIDMNTFKSKEFESITRAAQGLNVCSETIKKYDKKLYKDLFFYIS